MSGNVHYLGRKGKRAARRRNHIAFDLADVKYRQRVVDNKKPTPEIEEWDYEGESDDSIA